MSTQAKVIALNTERSMVEKSSFEWMLNLNEGIFAYTPVFQPMVQPNTKFLFEISFRRWLEGSLDEITVLIVTLMKQFEDSDPWSFEFTVSVHYSDGSLYKEYKSGIPLFLNEFSEQKCLSTNSRVYDLQSTTKNSHGLKIQSNTLILKCNMYFNCHLITSEEIIALQKLRNFKTTFENLYESNEFCDLSIQVGERTFKCHKFLLSAYSPVFNSMLSHDFREATTGVITISDFEAKNFASFLEYLYTDEVYDKSISNLKQLYMLADKYDVPSLKYECVNILKYYDFNEDEIEDFRLLLHQHQDKDLLNFLNFYLSNKKLMFNTAYP